MYIKNPCYHILKRNVNYEEKYSTIFIILFYDIVHVNDRLRVSLVGWIGMEMVQGHKSSTISKE